MFLLCLGCENGAFSQVQNLQVVPFCSSKIKALLSVDACGEDSGGGRDVVFLSNIKTNTLTNKDKTRRQKANGSFFL